MTPHQRRQFAQDTAAKLGVPWQSSFAAACDECLETWGSAQCEAHITRAIAKEQSRRDPTVYR